MHGRLRDVGTQLSGTDLPPLITDLSGQYSGYTDVQPCFDSLLYQMQHINETVIALPPAMQVWILSSIAVLPVACVFSKLLFQTLSSSEVTERCCPTCLIGVTD